MSRGSEWASFSPLSSSPPSSIPLRPLLRSASILADPLHPPPRFIFGTESYGGHYGPAFVTYFEQQNAAIEAGTLEGEIINVKALMVNKYVSFSVLSSSYSHHFATIVFTLC